MIVAMICVDFSSVSCTVLFFVFACAAVVVRDGMIPAGDKEVVVACECIMSSVWISLLPLCVTWIVVLTRLLLVGVINRMFDVSFLSRLGKL